MRPLYFAVVCSLSASSGCGASSDVQSEIGDVSSETLVEDATQRDSGSSTLDGDTEFADAEVSDVPTVDSGMSDTVVSDVSLDSALGDVLSDSSPTCAATKCSVYGSATVAGTVNVPALVELSGLVASRVNAGIVYAHDDELNQFFALMPDAGIVGKFVMTGVKANDPEDMAVGPCGSASCVYLADIGNNSFARDEHSIFRVVEPTLPPKATDIVNIPATRLRFYYPNPDGTRQTLNAETFMVHPITGAMYVVTKVSGKGLVYRLPDGMDAIAAKPAVKIAELTLGRGSLATGGDIHPCGDRFLLRTYGSLSEYRAPSVASFEDAFRATAIDVPVASEPQGEAVAYLANGSGFYTASESTAVGGHPLHVSACK